MCSQSALLPTWTALCAVDTGGVLLVQPFSNDVNVYFQISYTKHYFNYNKPINYKLGFNPNTT